MESCLRGLFLSCWILSHSDSSLKKSLQRVCVICHQRQLVTDRTMSSSKAVPAGHRKEAKPTALGNVRGCLVDSILLPTTNLCAGFQRSQQVIFTLKSGLGRRAKRAECRQPSVTVILQFGRFGWWLCCVCVRVEFCS